MRGRGITINRRKGRHASTVRRRVNWLMCHLELWDRHVDPHVIVFAMKRDGLIAKSTYWKDVNVEALCMLTLRERLREKS